jgi:hypothetical protein
LLSRLKREPALPVAKCLRPELNADTSPTQAPVVDLVISNHSTPKMKDESNELTELLKQDEHHNRDFDVSSDLVRQGITKQNAAITNVTAHFRRLSFNKKAEGKCIGTSQHVKCLSIFLHGGDAAGVILFCKGLALNTTIRSLRLIFYADAGEAQVDSDVLFETLLPFFENNANLNRFELCYNGSCWIST